MEVPSCANFGDFIFRAKQNFLPLIKSFLRSIYSEENFLKVIRSHTSESWQSPDDCRFLLKVLQKEWNTPALDAFNQRYASVPEHIRKAISLFNDEAHTKEITWFDGDTYVFGCKFMLYSV